MDIKTNVGQVQIADEVIAIIAGTAALEVEGVAYMTGNFTGDISEILGKKNLSKGVSITVNNDYVIIKLDLMIKFGYKLHETSYQVQKHVKEAIETMTGLNAKEININVTGLHIDAKEKEKEKEEK